MKTTVHKSAVPYPGDAAGIIDRAANVIEGECPSSFRSTFLGDDGQLPRGQGHKGNKG